MSWIKKQSKSLTSQPIRYIIADRFRGEIPNISYIQDAFENESNLIEL